MPDAWETLRAEAERAAQTVAVHPDVARWRAYRALDMVLATIEAYEGVPPQHQPLAERLTHPAFVRWLNTHPAPVKMWMHRIRQAGMIGAHVDTEWARSVEDAQRVVETLHKLLWWLTDTYGTVPTDTRPPIAWSDLDTPRSEEPDVGDAPNEDPADEAAPDSAPDSAPVSAPSRSRPEVPQESAETDRVADASVREQLRQIRSAPHATAAQRAAVQVLKHISTTNATLLTQFTPDA